MLLCASDKVFVKCHMVKRKVECTLVRALRLCTDRTAHSGSRGKALHFLDHGTRRGWGVSVMPQLLFTPPEKTRYPLYSRLGGPQGWSGQVRKISPAPGFDPRTVQPVASHYTDYATWPTNVIWNCQLLTPSNAIVLYIYIPTDCTQLIYFINNTLKHMYCLKL